MKILYENTLMPLSRTMRTRGTHGEALLWNALKQRQVCGYQFLRQRPVGPYITDFMCQRLKLIVEIDGSSHWEKITADVHRAAFLNHAGFTVLRFSEYAVCARCESVVCAIQEWIIAHAGMPRDVRKRRARQDTSASAARHGSGHGEA
jgi:very-short-patch-repair endonuclease